MPEDAVLRQIDGLRALGRAADAEELLRSALTEEPDDPHLLWRLAAVMLATDRAAEGLGAAHAAVRAAPYNPNAHRVHALLLCEAGFVGPALAPAYTAVTLAPTHAHTAVVYSHVLARANRYVEAAAVARYAVTLAPDDTETHAQVGDIALLANDRATARLAYQEVLRLDPEHAAARRGLAAVDHVSHRPREALQGLVVAGQLDPNLPEVLPLVTAVLWQLSWRMRIGLVVALLPVLVVSSTRGAETSWATRGIGMVIVLLAALAIWWHVRGLPRGTAPVLRAALRADSFLMLTYGFIVLCLAAYVGVAVSGIGAFAVVVWPLAILLTLIAVASRVAGAANRRAR